MKKVFILFIGFMVIATSAFATVTTLSYVSPSDVTITRMESNRQTLTDAANSVDGALIQAGTVTVTALTDNARTDKRWDDAFSDWVFTGLVVPTTSGTLTATTTSGRAYITGTRVEKDATAKLYTASKWTFVDLSSDGVYTYTETAIAASDPAITADSVRLSRVSSDTTQVFAVRDDRLTAITLGSEQENYQRENFTISVVTPDAITLSPGIIYNGTTRIIKTADTDLNLATAGDWATSGGSRTNSTKGYVVVNTSGTQYKLSTTDPTLTDTSGNTDGELRYSVIDSVNWRVLDWFWMDAIGSGNITEESYGAWRDNALPEEIIQVVNIQNGVPDGSTGNGTNVPNDNTVPTWAEVYNFTALDTSIVPTNANNTLRIDVVVSLCPDSAASIAYGIWQDPSGTDEALCIGSSYNASSTFADTKTLTYYMTAGTTDATIFKIAAGTIGGADDVNLNSITAHAAKFGESLISSVTITEIKQGV